MTSRAYRDRRENQAAARGCKDVGAEDSFHIVWRRRLVVENASKPVHNSNELKAGEDAAERTSYALALLEIACIFGVFFLHAGWPPPDPNEPHYLGKARHFWDASWCAGDPFLESPDAHYVFYITCGWLTRFLTIAQAAWVGRIVSWLLLAAAWRRLSRVVAPTWGAAIATGVGFVAFNEELHMAGEWVVGGFEAKGFAYAAVLVGWSHLAVGQWRPVWIWFGVAAAFHPLVGGWSVLAAAAAWLTVGRRDCSFGTMLGPLVLGGLLSLPGVLPTLLINSGVAAATKQAAAEVYLQRLDHHLDVFSFPSRFVQRFIGLTIVWGLLAWALRGNVRLRRLNAFAAAAVAISLLGCGISAAAQPEVETVAPWLRFYWHRLADFAVPAAAALTLFALLQVVRRLDARIGRSLWSIALVLAAWQMVRVAPRFWETRPRADKPGKVTNAEDWVDACHWVREHSEPGDLCWTPRTSQTFKWHAQRPELATWKDIPQDPTGLVAWRVRLGAAFRNHDHCGEGYWYDAPGELDPLGVLAVAETYGVRFILTETEYPIDDSVDRIVEVYSNDAYIIYEVAAAESIDLFAE